MLILENWPSTFAPSPKRSTIGVVSAIRLPWQLKLVTDWGILLRSTKSKPHEYKLRLSNLLHGRKSYDYKSEELNEQRSKFGNDDPSKFKAPEQNAKDKLVNVLLHFARTLSWFNLGHLTSPKPRILSTGISSELRLAHSLTISCVK